MGAIKCYVGFQKVVQKPLEYCDFVDLQGRYCSSDYTTQSNLDYLHIEVVKTNPNCIKEVLITNVCGISTQNPSQLYHQCFGHISIPRIWRMEKKGLM